MFNSHSHASLDIYLPCFGPINDDKKLHPNEIPLLEFMRQLFTLHVSSILFHSWFFFVLFLIYINCMLFLLNYRFYMFVQYLAQSAFITAIQNNHNSRCKEYFHTVERHDVNCNIKIAMKRQWGFNSS